MPHIRKPLLGGIAFGLFLATLRGHWDDLKSTHHENPFRVRVGDRGSIGDTNDHSTEHRWDSRLFSDEKKALAKEAKKEHAVLANSRAHDVDVAVGEKILRDFSTADDSADLSRPLQLQYPDPFKFFTGCTPESHIDGLKPRQLDLIADPTDQTWPINCEGHETLCDILKTTANNREVLAAVANSNAPGIFEFIDGIVKLGIKNFIIIALDDALHDKLKKRQGVASYRVKNDAVGSHKVSAQKFSIVKEFVERGCSVLLTDTDVAYLQNPFPYLYRDSDVESMSDGWDASSAFGFLETVDDASLGRDEHSGRKHAMTFRVAALNSGMWLVMATEASARLMTTMAHRMAHEPDLWDQSGYNLELWFNSRDDVRVSSATVRVLHPLCFVNSKVMFRFIRHAPNLSKEKHKPVAMHSNYHTDKAFKMQRVYAYYNNQNVGIEELSKGCTVGCGADLKTVTRLEKDARANVNDAIVGSKKWTDGAAGVWGHGHSQLKAGGSDNPQHCVPVEPLQGSGRYLKYKAHRVPGRRGDFCAKSDSSDSSETFALRKLVCAAVSGLTDPDVSEIFLITVDGKDDTAVGSFKQLLEQCVNRLNLDSKTLLVTNDAEVINVAKDFGVKAGVLVTDSDSSPDSSPDSTKSIPPSSPLRKSLTLLRWHVLTLLLNDSYDTLVIDPKTVLLKDPSNYFWDDADVQVLSDGWDDTTGYGYDHVVDDLAMDWSRFCHGGRVVGSDVGFVRFSATVESIQFGSLMARRIYAFLEEMDDNSDSSKYPYANLDKNDESSTKLLTVFQYEHVIFNELLYLPSQGSYVSPGVTKRTLNYLCFANSKTLFRFIRKDGKFKDATHHVPVVVRLSFHPNESVDRGKAVYEYYGLKGDQSALSVWSDSEGRGVESTQSTCASCGQDSTRLADAKKATSDEEDVHPLGKHFRLHRSWSWGGVTPFSFQPSGVLQTPWGEGTWGFILSNDEKSSITLPDKTKVYTNSVFVRFVGSLHVLTFEPSELDEPLGMFVSERCADGDMVVGRVVER